MPVAACHQPLYVGQFFAGQLGVACSRRSPRLKFLEPFLDLRFVGAAVQRFADLYRLVMLRTLA